MVDEKQREVQEKVLVYQILQNQLEEFSKQATVLETRLTELDTTENALKELKNVAVGSETLVPLGAGCYGHGKLLNKDKFMVEIGTGIMAEKTLPEAVSIIEDRRKEVEKVGMKLKAEMEKLANSMNQIGLDLQKLSKEAESKEKSEDKGDNKIIVE